MKSYNKVYREIEVQNIRTLSIVVFGYYDKHSCAKNDGGILSTPRYPEGKWQCSWGVLQEAQALSSSSSSLSFSVPESEASFSAVPFAAFRAYGSQSDKPRRGCCQRDTYLNAFYLSFPSSPFSGLNDLWLAVFFAVRGVFIFPLLSFVFPVNMPYH